VLPTDYWRLLFSAPPLGVDGLYWHRITQFILPCCSMIAASGNTISARA
jgi:hypothetical protein